MSIILFLLQTYTCIPCFLAMNLFKQTHPSDVRTVIYMIDSGQHPDSN